MDIYEAINLRKSVRAYDSKPVPKKTLLRVLEAARLAPSASNRQPWHFVVVTDLEKRRRLAQAQYAKFLTESPAVVVGCGDQKISPKWYMVDVAIALEHIVLAATNEGLGTCWIGSFDEDRVREMLKIPENLRIVALLAVGYPREKLERVVRPRKDFDKIASFEEFSKSATKQKNKSNGGPAGI